MIRLILKYRNYLIYIKLEHYLTDKECKSKTMRKRLAILLSGVLILSVNGMYAQDNPSIVSQLLVGAAFGDFMVTAINEEAK